METSFRGRDVCDIEVEGIAYWDAPDFCDAYISSARWKDTGELLNDEELNALNEDRDVVYEAVLDVIY